MDPDDDRARHGHGPCDRGQLTVQPALSLLSASPPVASTSASAHKLAVSRPVLIGGDGVTGGSEQTICLDEKGERRAGGESVIVLDSTDYDRVPAGDEAEDEMSLLLECGRGHGLPFHDCDLSRGHDHATPGDLAISRPSPRYYQATLLSAGQRPLLKRKTSSSKLGSRPCSPPRGREGRVSPSERQPVSLLGLPNELLFHILGFLDVCDVLSTSRVNHILRSLSLSPLLHRKRLHANAARLPPLLTSPLRPTLAELIARSIFLTSTTIISRRLARSLVSIRLARRLAARPSAEYLVEKAVLPRECVPGLAAAASGGRRRKKMDGDVVGGGGGVYVAPGLVAKRRDFERERVKDMLRRWVGGRWKGEVRNREESMRVWEEVRGVGRVWRLRRYWEKVSRGERMPAWTS